MKQLPADAVQRLHQVTLKTLSDRLGVLAQWRLDAGHYVPAALGENINATRGVRQKNGSVQMGLTRSEIDAVYRLLQRLIDQADHGRLTLVAAPGN